MALLTPKDIREHTFQTVRFKEGYDVDEVDDFLDQVTETVEALGRQAVAGGQATQSLGPDVTNLNAKISDLTGQVQQLESENAGLKNAVAQAQQAAQAAMIRQHSLSLPSSAKPRNPTARCPPRMSSSRVRSIS